MLQLTFYQFFQMSDFIIRKYASLFKIFICRHHSHSLYDLISHVTFVDRICFQIIWFLMLLARADIVCKPSQSYYWVPAVTNWTELFLWSLPSCVSQPTVWLKQSLPISLGMFSGIYTQINWSYLGSNQILWQC